MMMVMPVVVIPMMVMPMMMIMMMVMMLHRSGRRRRSGRGSGLLRDGVTGEAERERGGGGEGLDHGKVVLRLENPIGSWGTIGFPG